MRLFDLHADTPERLFHEGLSPTSTALHISSEAANALDEYAQCMAFWAKDTLSDDLAYQDILQMHAHWQSVKKQYPLRHTVIAIEDMRILNGHLDRLDALLALGFSVFTPLWRDESCIGGAWNTNLPLTPFGRIAVNAVLTAGAYPDISHASERAAWEIIELCRARNRPVLATHSGSSAVYPHKRNLSNEAARAIVDSQGLIGVTLVPCHLSSKDSADINDLLRHIEHFLSLGAETALCLGGDWDGTDVLAAKIQRISDVYILADELSARYPDKFVNDFLWQNAAAFFRASH